MNKKQYLFLIIIGLITYVLPVLSIYYEICDGWLDNFFLSIFVGIFGLIGFIILLSLLIIAPVIWIFKLIWEKLENA